MEKQAKLKVVKTGKYQYLYVRWKEYDTELRVNTGKNYKSATYHTVDLFYNSKYPDYKKENEALKELLEKTNKYIHACKKNKRKPSSKELKEYLRGKLHLDFKHPLFKKDGGSDVDLNSSASLFDLFGKFYAYKKSSLRSKYSFKDYTSLRNVLMEYNREEGITINKMNTVEFLPKLNYFLVHKRKMSDNTIHKRFQTLRSFMYYIEESDIITFKKSAFKFKPKKYQSVQYALTPEEVDYLSTFSCISRFHKNIKDIFIILCRTGMAYGDIGFINEDDIDLASVPPTYSYIREKTKEECIAPLSKDVLEILEEYNYSITPPTTQHFNREIKKILKNTGKFDDPIKLTNYQNGKKVIKKEFKYNLIGSHTGRRTFVTNSLAKGIGSNVVATVTGHKSIATINKYAKKVKDLSAFAD